MTTVGVRKESASGFERRGAIFRNVVIACAVLQGALFVVSDVIWTSMADEGLDRRLPLVVVYALVPVALLAIVQALPSGAWRWVGLAAFVLACIEALFFLSEFANFGLSLALLLSSSREALVLFLVSMALTVGCAAGIISCLFLGLYCRGWAREFAAAKAASPEGAGNQESAQKETV